MHYLKKYALFGSKINKEEMQHSSCTDDECETLNKYCFFSLPFYKRFSKFLYIS